jgi:hypothetical protein
MQPKNKQPPLVYARCGDQNENPTSEYQIFKESVEKIRMCTRLSLLKLRSRRHEALIAITRVMAMTGIEPLNNTCVLEAARTEF